MRRAALILVLLAAAGALAATVGRADPATIEAPGLSEALTDAARVDVICAPGDTPPLAGSHAFALFELRAGVQPTVWLTSEMCAAAERSIVRPGRYHGTLVQLAWWELARVQGAHVCTVTRACDPTDMGGQLVGGLTALEPTLRRAGIPTRWRQTIIAGIITALIAPEPNDATGPFPPPPSAAASRP